MAGILAVTDGEQPDSKAESRPLLTALLLLLVAAGMVAIVWRLIAERATFRETFLLGMALLLVALALLAALRRGPFWPRPLIATRGELAGFLLLLAVGTAMRTVGFDTFPPDDGQHSEEAQLGGGAYGAIHGGHLDSFFPLTTLTAESGFRLFGVSMRALRLPFLALGVLSVPLFFVAARLFFQSYAAALFASGLFATNAYLAGSSRIALESMSAITTLCLALAAVFYACVRRDPFCAAFAGFASGLVFLEYFSYKLVPVASAFLLLGRWLQDTNAPYCNAVGSPYRWAHLWRMRGYLLIGALFAIGALAAVLATDRENWGPVMEGYLRHRMEFDRQALPLGEALAGAAERVVRSAGYVFQNGEGEDVFPTSMGLLDPVTGWLGVAALAWCAARGRRCPAKRFLLLAVVLYVVLGGVLVPLPKRYRLIPVIPFFCLAAAVILDDLLAFLPRWRRAIVAASATLLVALGVLNAHRFFVVALHDPNAMTKFTDMDLVIGQGLGELQKSDPGATVYLLSDRSFFSNVNDYYFLYNHERVKVVATPEELAGLRGSVLAHEPFVDAAEKIPGVHDCRQWRPRPWPKTLIACRFSGG